MVYKIKGKSETTAQEKYFYFNSTSEWIKFKDTRFTHYPAWTFDENTLKIRQDK